MADSAAGPAVHGEERNDCEDELPAPRCSSPISRTSSVEDASFGKVEEDQDEVCEIPPYAELLLELGRPEESASGGDPSDEVAKKGPKPSDDQEKAEENTATGMVEEEEVVKTFDGEWVHQGIHIASISNGFFGWKESPLADPVKIIATENGFKLNNFGTPCEARLTGPEELMWTDGQLWTRLSPTTPIAGGIKDRVRPKISEAAVPTPDSPPAEESVEASPSGAVAPPPDAASQGRSAKTPANIVAGAPTPDSPPPAHSAKAPASIAEAPRPDSSTPPAKSEGKTPQSAAVAPTPDSPPPSRAAKASSSVAVAPTADSPPPARGMRARPSIVDFRPPARSAKKPPGTVAASTPDSQPAARSTRAPTHAPKGPLQESRAPSRQMTSIQAALKAKAPPPCSAKASCPQLFSEPEDTPPSTSSVGSGDSVKVLGSEALVEGRVKQALQLLMEARKREPYDTVVRELQDVATLCAWEDMGAPVMRMNSMDDAKRLYAEYRRPGNAAKARGRELFREKKYTEAMQHLAEAVELNKEDEVARKMLDFCRVLEWEAKGIPIMRADGWKEAIRLVDVCDKAAAKHEEELNDWYVNELRFPPEKRLTQEMLVKFWMLVQVWSAWPLEELQKEVDKRGVPARQAPERERQTRFYLATQLLLAERIDDWDERGLGASRLADPYAMMQVVEYNEQIDQASAEELLAWYSGLGFPKEMRLENDKQELAALAKKVYLWSALPYKELVEEVLYYGLSVDQGVVPGESEEEKQGHRTEKMVNKLLFTERMDAWAKVEDYSSKRLNNADITVEVVARHYEIDKMSLDDLMTWYTKLQFPPDRYLNREELVKLHKQVAVWETFPPNELLEDCKTRSVSVPEDVLQIRDVDDKQLRLINLLLFDDRLKYWQACGFPAKRVGDISAVMDLVREYESIHSAPLQELKAWYSGLGFPDEKDMSREDIVALYEKVTLWRYLPITELRAECVKRKINTGVQIDSEQYQLGLMDKLLLDDRRAYWDAHGYAAARIPVLEDVMRVVSVFEHYNKSSDEELLKLYRELSCPQGQSGSTVPNRRTMLRFLKQVMVWEQMPLRELQAECKNRGLPFNPVLPMFTIDERRMALVTSLREEMSLSKVFPQQETATPQLRDVMPCELGTQSNNPEAPDSSNKRADVLTAMAAQIARTLAVDAHAANTQAVVCQQGDGEKMEKEGEDQQQVKEEPEVCSLSSSCASLPALVLAEQTGQQSGDPVEPDSRQTRVTARRKQEGASRDYQRILPPTAKAEGLLSWANTTRRKERDLLERLLQLLGKEGQLKLDDVPEDPAECMEFLEDLGFCGWQETEQVRNALMDFRDSRTVKGEEAADEPDIELVRPRRPSSKLP